MGSKLYVKMPVLVCILVPYKDADFTEMGYSVLLPSESSVLESNIPFERNDSAVPVANPMDFMPSLSIEGPESISPNAVGEYIITASRFGQPENRSLTVYLEAVNGYLPLTRLNVSGSATFRVSSQYMQSGDSIKLKAGFCYRPAVTEYIMEVI
jgi:hypothetical protein